MKLNARRRRSSLKAKTANNKELVAKGESLECILPEAFALVREASKRVDGMPT